MLGEWGGGGGWLYNSCHGGCCENGLISDFNRYK